MHTLKFTQTPFLAHLNFISPHLNKESSTVRVAARYQLLFIYSFDIQRFRYCIKLQM